MAKKIVSESVSIGHPDKICDQLSDKILDAYIKQDLFAKVACECLITSKKIVIAGEVESTFDLNIPPLVHEVFDDIGLDREKDHFNYYQIPIDVILQRQSVELGQKVDNIVANEHVFSAGDQGLVYGFACKQTKQYLPLVSFICSSLMEKAASERLKGNLKGALSDMKCQVAAKDLGNCIEIEKIWVSSQHRANVNLSDLKKAFQHFVIDPTAKKFNFNQDFKFFFNPKGTFIKGGAAADTGLTGRKINIDTYGAFVPVGGGALSGKDATKVDRSGHYLARFLAKNIVASGLLDECLVLIAYTIGEESPIIFDISSPNLTFRLKKQISSFFLKYFSLKLSNIIKYFGFLKPIYYPTSKYGHFSSESFAWEKLDFVHLLRKEIKYER